MPTLASQYPNHDAARPLVSNSAYSTQISFPEPSHTYTSSSTGRRRSSEAGIGTLGSSPYTTTTRPRANTSFASLYATQNVTSTGDWQLPTVGQPIRGSWDFSSYLQPDSSSTGQDYRHKSTVKAEQGAAARYQEEEADQTASQTTITSGAT